MIKKSLSYLLLPVLMFYTLIPNGAAGSSCYMVHEKKSSNHGFSLKENPYKYSSGYQDSESSLYYLKARYYSSKLMRFISRDTYDLSNRYAYGNGNPISNIDPSGHNALSFLLALGAAVTAGALCIVAQWSFSCTAVLATKVLIGVADIATAANLGLSSYAAYKEGIDNNENNAWKNWSWESKDTLKNVGYIADSVLNTTSFIFFLRINACHNNSEICRFIAIDINFLYKYPYLIEIPFVSMIAAPVLSYGVPEGARPIFKEYNMFFNTLFSGE